MAQFDIYLNPGTMKFEVPYLVSVQGDHITNKTGTTVIILLRTNTPPVEVLASLVEAGEYGNFVLSTNEFSPSTLPDLKLLWSN